MLASGKTPTQAVAQLDVLVVDDDTAVRTSFASILRTSGFSVAEAADGLDALSIVRSTLVGVMLLDLQMPRLDGLGLLDALPTPPPVILLTARDYDAEVVRRRAKVFAYLQKPVLPAEMRILVRQAIGSG
jgi:CheY-like chemotaxis protein